MAKRAKKEVTPPKNLQEAAAFISRVAEVQGKIDVINTALNASIAKLKEEAMANAQPLEEDLEVTVAGLFIFAENNRETLLGKDEPKKSVDLPTGTFGWRKHPPAVKLTKIDDVLAALKEAKLRRFIRKVEEPDKQAMLKEPELAETVKGVKIVKEEQFFIKPSAVSAEIVNDAVKLRKELKK